MPSVQPQSHTPDTFTSQNPPEPQYHYFRGHKKRISEMNKTKMLKTKRVREKQQKVLRYDDGQDEFFQMDADKNQQVEMKKSETSRLDCQRRVKSQFQMMKLNPTEKLQRMHRNKSSNDTHQLMIRTSRMQITPVQTSRFSSHLKKNAPSTSLPLSSQQQPMTMFYSKNLQERMNEYLNMVVAKSSQDHNEKVRRMREQEEKLMEGQRGKRDRDTKIFVKNKFLRELKTRTSLIKKNPLNNSHNDSPHQTSHNTSRNGQLTSRTSKNFASRQAPISGSQNFSLSRVGASNNHSIHNHSSGNGKMAEGQELINFASEVLSRSMKVYGSGRARVKENSVKRLNCSVQMTHQ